MNKIKLTLIMSIILLISSCRDTEKLKNIYYNNGKIAQEKKYLGNNDFYVKNYYKSGEINSEGRIKNNKTIGWWKMYENNKTKYRFNFIIISGKVYLNQKIKYDSNEKILENESNYFNLDIPDTLKVGKTKINVFYKPLFSKKSDVFICVGYKIDENFDNIKNVRIDTFYTPNSKNAWFGLKYESPGKKIVRGFIYERNVTIKDNLGINKDSAMAVINDRTSYFEKEIYVKPDRADMSTQR